MPKIIKANEPKGSKHIKWDYHRWNDFIKSFNDIDYCDTTCSDTITVGGIKIAVRFNAREQF